MTIVIIKNTYKYGKQIKFIVLQGGLMSKFTTFNNYVRVPCKKCHELVRVGIYEKLTVCPHCRSKWS